MLRKFNRKGQNTLEYVLLITCVVAAFLAINTYFKQAVIGKVRDSADDIGQQFHPETTSYNYETRAARKVTEKVNVEDQDAYKRTQLLEDAVSKKWGSETLTAD